MVGEASFALSAVVSRHITVAFHQNAIPVLHEIVLGNTGESDLSDIELTVSSEPSFLRPVTLRIERIAAGATQHLTDPNVQLDAGFLRNVSEGIFGSLTIRAVVAGEFIAEHTSPVQIYPPSHWGGSGAAPELLAAFVRPNDPAVDAVLRDAAAKLNSAGKSNAIDGYRSRSRQRSWELASAIWAALADRNLAYVLPPASFEHSGQKVRGPSDILDRRLATCLDSTLLFAACLEQAHLNPIIVVTRGHAFVGVWLKEDSFSATIVDDPQVLRKRRDLEDIVFIETTLLTHVPPAPFQYAVDHAAKLIDEGAAEPLEFALDVKRARDRGIRPLELAEATFAVRPTDIEATAEMGIDDTPPFRDDIVVGDAFESSADRIERWKRRLLDLTLRNKLLNFKDAKKSVGIECSDPGRLEDLLSSGQRFKLLAKTDVLGDKDPRSAALFQEQRHDDARRRLVLEALDRNELHTDLSDKELDYRLTELFRMARTAFEEGGSNVLFMAIGFLKWTQKEGSKELRAPLILVPVSLHRSSMRTGFRLAIHEEEARFNPTLLQMLRQDQKLSIPELETELPADESGLDVLRIWQIVRTHIRDLRGWELTTDVVLSTFSFIKFLMWKDLVDRIDVLKRNPVVRHLVDTPKHTYGDGSAFPEPSTIDRDHHPVDLFAPLSADSSQLSAVLAAAAGKDFVLFGPPGTGKSQTIANMISQCLALGKTVLFVSQKTAALEVVQRRLHDIGLGQYCLEVHSTKAQKSAVLGQLKAAWHERHAPRADDWETATGELAKLRDDLNVLVSALHRRRKNGLSAYEAFGRAVATKGLFDAVKLDWGSVEHTPAELAGMRELVKQMRIDLLDVGDPGTHPLRGIGATEWTSTWRTEMTDATRRFADAAHGFDGKPTAFAETLGLTAADTPLATVGLRWLGQLLTHPEARHGAQFLASGDVLHHALAELREMQKRHGDLSAQLHGTYRKSAFSEDLRSLLSEWVEATNSNFMLRGTRQRMVRNKLQPFANSALPDDLGGELVTLLELQALEREWNEKLGPFAVFGSDALDIDTDLAVFNSSLAWCVEAQDTSRKLSSLFGLTQDQLRQHIIYLLSEFEHLFNLDGAATCAYNALCNGSAKVADTQKHLATLAGRPDPRQPLASGPGWIVESVEIAERWSSNLHRAQGWCHWNKTAKQARTVGLSALVDALEQGTLASEDASPAFEAAYARWWTDRVMSEDLVLRAFTAVRQDDIIARFRAADARVGELCKRIVQARLKGDVPAPTAFGDDPEWGTLARELTKRARHQPLRQLFAKMPNVLTRLTPCLMMSPLSIAQYLPPDSVPFDVVIFDEASQIPVWEAVGAIARGKQVVIVGDPEQLPPTSVGERDVDDIEDGTDVEDQESILDECLSSNIPQQRLDWHYRSRSESLIAFSNRNYYNGRLVTFPSPSTDDRAVSYVHVPGGVYERGAGRVNREEARAVVAEVIRRLEDPEFAHLRSSLGVVTFNGEQQRLIENMLDQERRAHPDLDMYFDPARWHEPVFVKNLENVQGDERNVILFSVAVAPDGSGRGVVTISSLNKNGGHRRLNVAITRARQEMVVFATLRAEQIDMTRTAARGVRDFKHFLEFAERGPRAIAEAFALTGEGTESPFEDAVKAALEARGWTVHTQIGVSAFRVDLGVVDPDAPGRYLAGVECDGATYHRSATARDRDRLREHVLTQLGWRIRRVWSTDWWMDADRAVEKLDSQLKADLEVSRIDRAAAESAAAARAVARQITSVHVSDDAAEAGTSLVSSAPETSWTPEPAGVTEAFRASVDGEELLPERPRLYADAAATSKMHLSPANRTEAFGEAYRVADFAGTGLTPEPGRFYEPLYRQTLRLMVAHVISVEGPIYEDLLVQRLSRAHGFGRAANRIREAIAGAVTSRFPRTADGGRTVYWPENTDPARSVRFRDCLNGDRDHGDIPLAELASLASSLSQDGMDTEEIVRSMGVRLRLGRLRESTRERLEEALTLARRSARGSD